MSTPKYKNLFCQTSKKGVSCMQVFTVSIFKKTFMSGTSIIIDVPLIIISPKIFIRRFQIKKTGELKEEDSSLSDIFFYNVIIF